MGGVPVPDAFGVVINAEGFVLTEITPGLHPYYSVLQWIPFPVRVAPRLRYMPASCYSFLAEGEAKQ